MIQSLDQCACLFACETVPKDFFDHIHHQNEFLTIKINKKHLSFYMHSVLLLFRFRRRVGCRGMSGDFQDPLKVNLLVK